jgi:hypothetical protein
MSGPRLICGILADFLGRTSGPGLQSTVTDRGSVAFVAGFVTELFRYFNDVPLWRLWRPEAPVHARTHTRVSQEKWNVTISQRHKYYLL